MRALLSVYDKTGLEELARGLTDLGWELISSGGTSHALAVAGIAYREVADVTGAPEMLGGRVKTLHPAIAGGILADRGRPDHLSDLEARGIEPIDLVVCNLYPFRTEPSIEMIDIGGPTMVRAAAKNHESVGVVVDPARYGEVLAELTDRRSLARHPPRPGPRRLRPRGRLRRRHRGLVRRPGRTGTATASGPSCCPPPSSWSSNAPAPSATARTLTSVAPATASPACGRGGTRSSNTAAPNSPTSTSSTPTPPGGWCTSCAIRAVTCERWPSSSTPTHAGRRWPATCPPPTGSPWSATSSRPSAASWPSAAPWTRRWPRPSPAAPRPTSSWPPPTRRVHVTGW